MTSLVDQIDSFIADLERRKFRQNTLISYRSDLMIAARHLLEPLDQTTIDDIEVFLVSSSLSPATVARRTVSLKRFFGWAKKQGLCAHNPLADREPTRAAVRRLPRPVQHQSDLAAIDAAIVVAPKPYRLIFTILRETGMRVGEVLALNLSDVFLEPGREGLRVREPKNGSERIAPLGANATPKSLRGLRALVKELKGQPGHVPVFRSNRGTRISYSAAQYQVSANKRWVNLPRAARPGAVASICV